MSAFNKLTETNPKVIKLLLHIHVHVLRKLGETTLYNTNIYNYTYPVGLIVWFV